MYGTQTYRKIGNIFKAVLLLVGLLVFPPEIADGDIVPPLKPMVTVEQMPFLYDRIESKDVDSFIGEVTKLALKWNRPYEDFAMLLFSESGKRRIKATAKNTVYPFKDGTCAYGIWQITPPVRKDLKITYGQLLQMNEFEQLKLFDKYLERWNKPITCYSDLYLLTFLPAYHGRPDNTSTLRYFSSNPLFGKTLGEFRRFVEKDYEIWLKQYNIE